MAARDFPVHPFIRTIVLVIALLCTGVLSIRFLDIAANFPGGVLGENIVETGLIVFQVISPISIIMFILFLHYKVSKWRVYIDETGIRREDEVKGNIGISYADVTQAVLPDFSSLSRYSFTMISGGTQLRVMFIEFEEVMVQIIESLGEAGYEFNEANLRRFKETKIFGQRRVRRIHRLLPIVALAIMFSVMLIGVFATGGVGKNVGASILGIICLTPLPLLGWVISEVLLGRAFQRGSYAQPDSTREENFSTECHYFTVGYALAAGLMVVGYGALLAVF